MAQGEDRQRLSVADLVLTGHDEVAQFALGMSSAQPLVASGGNDCQARAAWPLLPDPARVLVPIEPGWL